MKQLEKTGIYQKSNKVYTINPEQCKNIKVYGENLRNIKGIQYRLWNPFRSKLAAVLSKKQIIFPFKHSTTILYLGAATGTTVSHLSDICIKGWIYAVEPSPVAAKTLMTLINQRRNIIPIIEDANHPDRYNHFISQRVDFVYQDISQRNQAEILAKNATQFLKKKGQGILMVKARSIDVGMKPADTYDLVKNQLIDFGLKINDVIELSPYKKDHAAILIENK